MKHTWIYDGILSKPVYNVCLYRSFSFHRLFCFGSFYAQTLALSKRQCHKLHYQGSHVLLYEHNIWHNKIKRFLHHLELHKQKQCPCHIHKTFSCYFHSHLFHWNVFCLIKFEPLSKIWISMIISIIAAWNHACNCMFYSVFDNIN